MEHYLKMSEWDKASFFCQNAKLSLRGNWYSNGRESNMASKQKTIPTLSDDCDCRAPVYTHAHTHTNA